MKKILLIVETITIIFLLLILASKNSKNQFDNEAKDDSDVSTIEVTKDKEVFRELSPDGDYGLVIFEIGSPGFAFGTDKLRITLYEVLPENEMKAYYRASFEAEVANDGAAAIFHVEWLEDGVQICLDGEEQPAAYYILPYVK